MVWRSREQAHRGDVRGHHLVRCEAFRRLVRAEIGGGGVCQLRIGQQKRRLAQRPQSCAQGCGTAHRVPIRADMGEDQNIVKGPQRPRSGGPSACSFLRFAGVRVVLASSCRSTWRRISRMWAPCWMESSAMNCGSGVYRSCRARPSSAAGSRRRISGPSARLSPGPCPEH